MQKRKSFLMKLLVLLTVVFCTFALAFGMVGCATDGNDGAGIKNVSIVNGQLTIEYTNGKVETVGSVTGDKGEQGGTLAEGCNHTFVTNTVRWANCAETQLDVQLCTKCNGYKLVEGEKAEGVHYSLKTVADEDGHLVLQKIDYSEKSGDSKEATCYEAGYIKTVCSQCGVVTRDEAIPAYNHMIEKDGEKASAFQYITGAKENENVCIDGTFSAYICTLCFTVDENGTLSGTGVAAKYDTTDVPGHHTADSTWTLKTMPTMETEGEIEGVCTVCKTEQTITLNELSDTTFYTITVPTCITYKSGDITKKVWTANVYGYNFKYEEDYTISHRLQYNGTDYVFAHAKSTTEDLTTIKTLVAKTSMAWSVEPGNCEEEGYLTFTCEDCGKDIVILSKGEHEYQDVTENGAIVYVEATCTAKKYHNEQCKICGDIKKVEEGDVRGHAYVQVEETVVKNANGTVTFTAKCNREGCTATQTVTGTKNLTESKPANCKEDGYDVYDLDKAIAGSTKFELPVNKLTGHKITLNGENYEFEHGKLTSYDKEVIDALVKDAEKSDENDFRWSVSPGNCTTTGLAIFTCPDCGEEIIVDAKGAHTYKDVVDEAGLRVDHTATCLKEGYYEQICELCGDVKSVKLAEKLAHAWVKDGEPVKHADGTITINVKCNNGCNDTKEFTGRLSADSKKTFAATCSAKGQEYYTLDTAVDGNNFFIVELEKINEHKLTNGDETYLFTHGAVTEYTFEEIDALMDVESNDFRWTVEPGNCLVEGFAIFTCPDCDGEVIVKAIGSHKNVVVKGEDGEILYHYATCTENKYYETKCSVCEKVNKVGIEDTKLGHNWVKDGDASRNDDNTVTINVKCTRCGETDTIKGTLKDTIVATCESVAKEVYTYTLNGSVAEIEIVTGEALGHDYREELIEWQVTVDGVKYDCQGKICTRCNKLVVTSMKKATNA